jgi:D-glycero-D-manno-heptose 1,7-bisphosphate phosphatase
LAVVTNQPDVGNGVTARSEVDARLEIMTRELPVDAVKACFHRQTDNCDCRKPKPGMILEAAAELGIDRKGDVDAGRAAGCATVFIDLGYAEAAPDGPDHVVHSIAEATDVIIETSPAVQEAS